MKFYIKHINTLFRLDHKNNDGMNIQQWWWQKKIMETNTWQELKHTKFFFFFFPCSMLTAVHRWVSKSKLLCTSSKQLKHTSLNIYIYIYHPLSIQMSREFALQVQRLEHILRITVVEKQKTYFWGIKNHQYNVWWFSNSNDLRDKHKSNLIVTKILFSG